MQAFGVRPVLPVRTLALTIGALLAVGGAVEAQQLDEIIVTAERRALNLQDTPISVMSFEGDALQLRGIEDLGDLATIAPNLDIKGSRGTRDTNFSLRYAPNDGKWSTTFFVNNLTDEVYANNAQSFGRGYWTQGGPAGGSGYSAPPRQAVSDYRGRPREYGLTFQYGFY